jgi:hypothetical protein
MMHLEASLDSGKETYFKAIEKESLHKISLIFMAPYMLARYMFD